MNLHGRAVAALARPAPSGAAGVLLASPGPGLFRLAVRPGDVVHPEGVLGELEVLGRRVTVAVPAGVRGVVTAVCSESLARPAVDHGAMLAEVATGSSAVSEVAAAATGSAAAATGSAADPATPAAGSSFFRSPTSGRFYSRQTPDSPPFVSPGDELAQGATICLLEVMKTFHRVTYSGEPARVRAVLVDDGTDVNAGDALLALE